LKTPSKYKEKHWKNPGHETCIRIKGYQDIYPSPGEKYPRENFLRGKYLGEQLPRRGRPGEIYSGANTWEEMYWGCLYRVKLTKLSKITNLHRQ